MRTIKVVSAILLAAFCFACAGDDEARIRTLVRETFDSAQRGDIGFMMERVHEENSALLLLVQLKKKSEKDFDFALAELGKKTSELLKGKTLEIESIDISSERAVVAYSISAGEAEEKGSCLLVKTLDGWKFRTLPGMEGK